MVAEAAATFNSRAKKLIRQRSFNIVARNPDDHVKDITFLMDEAGRRSRPVLMCLRVQSGRRLDGQPSDDRKWKAVGADLILDYLQLRNPS